VRPAGHRCARQPVTPWQALDRRAVLPSMPLVPGEPDGLLVAGGGVDHHQVVDQQPKQRNSGVFWAGDGGRSTGGGLGRLSHGRRGGRDLTALAGKKTADDDEPLRNPPTVPTDDADGQRAEHDERSDDSESCSRAQHDQCCRDAQFQHHHIRHREATEAGAHGASPNVRGGPSACRLRSCRPDRPSTPPSAEDMSSALPPRPRSPTAIWLP